MKQTAYLNAENTLNGKDIETSYSILDNDVTSVIERLKETGFGPIQPMPFDNSEAIRLQGCIELSARHAELYKSKLNETDILNMEGMSSMKVRHFLNNIFSSNIFSEKNYLEIGCASGSTYISSNFRNELNSSYVCDIFNELKNGKDGKDIFLKNCRKHLGRVPNNLFHEDCFSLDLSKFNHKINMYLFDGDHSINSHELALTYFESIFDDTVVVAIDDWDDWRVQLGTILGLSKINYDVFSWQYLPGRTSFLEIDSVILKKCGLRIFEDEPFGDITRYWNGLFVMTLSKRKIEQIEPIGETL